MLQSSDSALTSGGTRMTFPGHKSQEHACTPLDQASMTQKLSVYYLINKWPWSCKQGQTCGLSHPGTTSSSSSQVFW